MSGCTATIKLKTSDFTILTCECYYSNWKEIRKSNNENWKFDKIESGKKSFRKLFHQKMTIFHCCHSCFEKIVIMNPIVMNSNNAYGNCLKAKFVNMQDCSVICDGCVLFFIMLFKDKLFAL